MSWIIAFILVGIWAVALVTGVTLGGYIHLVLALAVGIVFLHVRGTQISTA